MMKLAVLTFIFSLQAAAVQSSLQTATTENTANASVVAATAEDQIPLTIVPTAKPDTASNTSAKAAMSLVVVMILLGVSYYLVRRYKISNTINKSNMQIKVLSQHYLGPKKSLAIVHVAGESMLIGVTDSNISMIKSLSLIDDEVPVGVPNHFGQALAKAAETTTPTQTTTTAMPDRHELDEEFSFSNVTDTVSKKIKSMRSFS